MDGKRWGTFLCNCRSSLNVDLKKISDLDSLVEVVSDPDKEIHAFADKVEKEGLENIIVGCCNEESFFKEALKGKTLHFLDLKGKCFAPHDDVKVAHEKAVRLINTEINLYK